MSNAKKTLPSGAEIDLMVAPLKDCHKLFKAVMAELEHVKIEMGAGNMDLKEFAKSQVNENLLNTIKNVTCRLMFSEKVEEALWPCMSRSTYNSQKITKESFESVESRSDFLVVAKEVLWFNLAPFFESLGLLFQDLLPIALNVQNSAPKSMNAL